MKQKKNPREDDVGEALCVIWDCTSVFLVSAFTKARTTHQKQRKNPTMWHLIYHLTNRKPKLTVSEALYGLR